MPRALAHGDGVGRRWLALQIDPVLGALLDVATQPSEPVAMAVGVVAAVAGGGLLLTAATHASTGARRRALVDAGFAAAMTMISAWYLAGLVRT